LGQEFQSTGTHVVCACGLLGSSAGLPGPYRADRVRSVHCQAQHREGTRGHGGNDRFRQKEGAQQRRAQEQPAGSIPTGRRSCASWRPSSGPRPLASAGSLPCPGFRSGGAHGSHGRRLAGNCSFIGADLSVLLARGPGFHASFAPTIWSIGTIANSILRSKVRGLKVGNRPGGKPRACP